ncbi:MFS transporter [Paraburkholderia oxyphila]|uniref:MFS transporter n=1 Tax=Paraburkholderia oxyphila TaxID=614212 RepID=UPI0005B8A7B6|nr:MFS transporter [Paraburkholderia oxyphila]
MERPLRSIRLGSVDVTDVIDRGSMSGTAWRVLALCLIAMLVDGFDIQVITYVAPVLTRALGVNRALLGPVFSSGLVGTTLGAFIFGSLGDRLGRKQVLCACLLIFAICSLGTTTASGIESLMAWRFVSGLGLGGLTPLTVTYVAEFCPGRYKVPAAMITTSGYAIGAAGGGLLASFMIPMFGWRSVFLLGGVTPLLIAIAIAALLPHSIFDLARRGYGDQLAKAIQGIAPNISVDPRAQISLAEKAAGFPVGRLFAEGRTPRTIALWVMFFANILSLYFMVSWLPTIAHTSGIELSAAVRAAAVMQVGSVLGTFSLAALVRRFDTFSMVGTGFGVGALALVLLAFAGSSVQYFTTVAFLAGFFVIGTQTGANAVSAFAYPPSLRSTGVGWALGIGRTGAILGPSVGGVLMALGWPTRDLLLLAACPALLASCCGFVLSCMLRRSSDVRDAVASPTGC